MSTSSVPASFAAECTLRQVLKMKACTAEYAVGNACCPIVEALLRVCFDVRWCGALYSLFMAAVPSCICLRNVCPESTRARDSQVLVGFVLSFSPSDLSSVDSNAMIGARR